MQTSAMKDSWCRLKVSLNSIIGQRLLKDASRHPELWSDADLAAEMFLINPACFGQSDYSQGEMIKQCLTSSYVEDLVLGLKGIAQHNYAKAFKQEDNFRLAESLAKSPLLASMTTKRHLKVVITAFINLAEQLNSKQTSKLVCQIKESLQQWLEDDHLRFKASVLLVTLCKKCYLKSDDSCLIVAQLQLNELVESFMKVDDNNFCSNHRHQEHMPQLPLPIDLKHTSLDSSHKRIIPEQDFELMNLQNYGNVDEVRSDTKMSEEVAEFLYLQKIRIYLNLNKFYNSYPPSEWSDWNIVAIPQFIEWLNFPFRYPHAAADQIDYLILNFQQKFNAKLNFPKKFQSIIDLVVSLSDTKLSRLFQYMSTYPRLIFSYLVKKLFFEKADHAKRFLNLGLFELVQASRDDDLCEVWHLLVNYHGAHLHFIQHEKLLDLVLRVISQVSYEEDHKTLQACYGCLTFVCRILGLGPIISEERLIIEETKIKSISVPYDFGKNSEVIFNESLRTIYPLKLVNSSSRKPLSPRAIGLHVQTTSSKLFLDRIVFKLNHQVPIHTQIYFSGLNLFFVNHEAGIFKMKNCYRAAYPIFTLTRFVSRLISIEHVHYGNPGTILCYVAHPPPRMPSILVFNSRIHKVARIIDCSQQTLWPMKFFQTNQSIIGISVVQMTTLKFVYLCTDQIFKHQVSDNEYILASHARGDLCVSLCNFSVKVFKLYKNSVELIMTLRNIEFAPFKQLYFLNKDQIVLASRFYGRKVMVQLTLVKLQDRSQLKARVKYGFLKEIVEPMLDGRTCQYEKYTRYFMRSSKERLLYASKINRVLLPYSSYDPYSSLTLINLPL